MIQREEILSSSRENTFQARLYYNIESTVFRENTIHAHPPMEISIPGCSGVYIVGEEEIPFENGDIFLFRSNERHGISKLYGDGDALCLGFHFFPDIFWSTLEQELVPEFIAAFSRDRKNFPNKISGDNPHAKAILKILKEIETEFEDKYHHYDAAVRANISLLMLQLLRACPPNKEPKFKGKTEHIRQATALMQYIDAHCSEKLSLPELGEVVHMNPAYLSHIFRETTGFSLWDYIIARRIELAKQLLISTNRKILDIAFECGFQNSANFNKSFRKQTGITPSEYRGEKNLDFNKNTVDDN